MTVQMFLALLSAFSVLTGLIVELIKKIATDKANISYNLTALIVALIVGSVGTAIYYYLNDILFTGKNIVFMLLLGFASALVAEMGYDKVVQCVKQLTKIE